MAIVYPTPNSADTRNSRDLLQSRTSMDFTILPPLVPQPRAHRAAVDSRIRMHYERLSHSPAHISRPLSGQNVCATPARLRYRFPSCSATSYALLRLMDSSSSIARTSLTFNANAFQQFLDQLPTEFSTPSIPFPLMDYCRLLESERAS